MLVPAGDCADQASQDGCRARGWRGQGGGRTATEIRDEQARTHAASRTHSAMSGCSSQAHQPERQKSGDAGQGHAEPDAAARTSRSTKRLDVDLDHQRPGCS